MNSVQLLTSEEDNLFTVPNDHNQDPNTMYEINYDPLLKTVMRNDDTQKLTKEEEEQQQQHYHCEEPKRCVLPHPNAIIDGDISIFSQLHQATTYSNHQCTMKDNNRTHVPAISYRASHDQNRHIHQYPSKIIAMTNKSRCWFTSLSPLVIFSVFLMSVISVSDWSAAHAQQVGSSSINAGECSSSSDCGDLDKICYEEKCICKKDKPVEDTRTNSTTLKKCFGLKNIGEGCSMTEQCLAQSRCLEGVCSCGSGIKIFNPSAHIDYCHEKKNLRQICSFSEQCPENSYCSLDKLGCLCANGYAESYGQCKAKICKKQIDCETDLYKCEGGLCMCHPGNFDLTTAKCLRFGGVSEIDKSRNGTNTISNNSRNDDDSWIVLIITAITVFLILSLLILLYKKHYLRFRIRTYKKEYEPNNKSIPKNGFHSNPINNKSFKRKLENESLHNQAAANMQSPDKSRKISDVDVNLDINDADEHEIMISDKINKPLVNPTSTTV